MSKRNLATILWALSGWTLGSFLSFVFGLPGGLDIAFSFVAGGFIWWDPAGVLWSRQRQTVKRPAEAIPSQKLATD